MMKQTRETALDALRSAGVACAIAAVIFCAAGVIADIAHAGSFCLYGYAFTRMVLGCFGVGLGFGLPSVVYRNERLPLTVRTLIHMGIGCVVMTLIAFSVGWVPAGLGAPAVLLAVLAEIAAAFLIWLCFYVHQRRLAGVLNRRIEERNRSDG